MGQSHPRPYSLTFIEFFCRPGAGTEHFAWSRFPLILPATLLGRLRSWFHFTGESTEAQTWLSRWAPRGGEGY